jgi:hypothetical protein
MAISNAPDKSIREDLVGMTQLIRRYGEPRWGRKMKAQTGKWQLVPL